MTAIGDVPGRSSLKRQFRYGLVGVVLLACVAIAYRVGRESPASSRAGGGAGDERALAESATAPGPSRAGFRPDVIDFGTQLWGTALPFEVVFHNDGPTPLEIENVETSCGCAVVGGLGELRGRVVQVGDAVPIQVTLNVQTAPGPKTASVTVHCASGETFRARASAIVKGTWELLPESLDFGEIVLDGATSEAPARTFMFHSEIDSLIGSPVADAPWLLCTTAARGAGQVEVLVVVLTDKLPPGKHQSLISVRTTNSIAPGGVVYVSAFGRQELICTPSQLFLQGDEAHVVRVRSSDGRVPDLVHVEASNPAISVMLAGPGEVRVRNASGQAVAELVTVWLRDDQGHRGRILVSTF